MNMQYIVVFGLAIFLWCFLDLLDANLYRICKRKRYKCRKRKCKKWMSCEYAKRKPDINIISESEDKETEEKEKGINTELSE